MSRTVNGSLLKHKGIQTEDSYSVVCIQVKSKPMQSMMV